MSSSNVVSVNASSLSCTWREISVGVARPRAIGTKAVVAFVVFFAAGGRPGMIYWKVPFAIDRVSEVSYRHKRRQSSYRSEALRKHTSWDAMVSAAWVAGQRWTPPLHNFEGTALHFVSFREYTRSDYILESSSF